MKSKIDGLFLTIPTVLLFAGGASMIGSKVAVALVALSVILSYFAGILVGRSMGQTE